ncbi:hypothetical protein QQF64_019524 [Cirrhinus molitorella]|uniref:Secreted protein n=1 Tax=Cirrhinus molitorella TaxID=172907 RepID=A0ABR3LFQ3_9TELE
MLLSLCWVLVSHLKSKSVSSLNKKWGCLQSTHKEKHRDHTNTILTHLKDKMPCCFGLCTGTPFLHYSKWPSGTWQCLPPVLQ